MTTVNEALQSQLIAHAVHTEKFGSGLAEKIVELLDEVEDDLVGQIASRLAKIEGRGIDTGPATTARLQELLTVVQTINDGVYRKIGTEAENALTDLATYEGDYQQKVLTDALPVSFPVRIPDANVLRLLVTTSPIDGHLLSSWTDTMSSNARGRVEKVIRTGMVQGQTIDQMVAGIRGTRAQGYKDGVLEISRNSAKTLALTATSTVSNNARLAVFQANPVLVPRVQWLSVLDKRTSSICQRLDHQVFPIDKPHPTPPAHPRCRSILLPVTPTFRELGVDIDEVPKGSRASMDGQVAGGTSYGDWLTRQSKARQNEILGQTRAEMFRSGDVKFDDLYRTDGSYKTIAELKQAEKVVR